MCVLLVDVPWPIEHAMREAADSFGLSVVSVSSGGGILHLPSYLDSLQVQPSLFFQCEVLGPRTFFRGLEQVGCPTVFWGIDSHLNLFWQKWYARLFDLVLTPHVSLFEALPEALQLKRIRRYTWPGESRRFVPYAKRSTGLGLCARIDASRPIRKWLVELLEPLGIKRVENIFGEDMMRFYDDTRVVLNECIANEVNFRIMEGASAGALVLSPDVGADQNALFVPGKEFLVYHDGLELLEQAHWAAAHPQAAEKMGRAAFARIQEEHLPAHRARLVLETVFGPRTKMAGGQDNRYARYNGFGSARAYEIEAEAAWWLTVALQIRNGYLKMNPVSYAKKGQRLARSLVAAGKTVFAGHVLAQCLCLYAEAEFLARGIQKYDVSAGSTCAYALCKSIAAAASGKVGDVGGWQADTLAADDGAEDSMPASFTYGLDVFSAASAFAIRENMVTMAASFAAAYSAEIGKPRKVPVNVAELALFWSGELARNGQVFDAGLRFVPEDGNLPGSALAWLFFARQYIPLSEYRRRLTSALDALIGSRPDYLSMALGVKAEHSLVTPENFRLQQEYGLLCLQAGKVREGLLELYEALGKAEKNGRARLFFSRLRQWPARSWGKNETPESASERDWQELLTDG